MSQCSVPQKCAIATRIASTQHLRMIDTHMPNSFYQVSAEPAAPDDILFSSTPMLRRANKGWQLLLDHQCTCRVCQLFVAHWLTTGPQHNTGEVIKILGQQQHAIERIILLLLVFCHRTVLSSLGCCSFHGCLWSMLHTSTSRSTHVVWQIVKRNHLTATKFVRIHLEHRVKPRCQVVTQ